MHCSIVFPVLLTLLLSKQKNIKTVLPLRTFDVVLCRETVQWSFCAKKCLYDKFQYEIVKGLSDIVKLLTLYEIRYMVMEILPTVENLHYILMKENHVLSFTSYYK